MLSNQLVFGWRVEGGEVIDTVRTVIGAKGELGEFKKPQFLKKAWGRKLLLGGCFSWFKNAYCSISM